jgi:hypothetical protein
MSFRPMAQQWCALAVNWISPPRPGCTRNSSGWSIVGFAVTVDLARLTFIDSHGLSVLVMAMKRFRDGGGDLELRSPNPATQHIFDVTGLTKAFAIS